MLIQAPGRARRLGALALFIGTLALAGHGGGRDDLVGTLPVIYGNPTASGLTGPDGEAPTSDAALVLTGSHAGLTASLQDASGQGWIHAVPGAQPGEWVWTVYGDVILFLDRAMVEAGAVDARLEVGTDKLGGLAVTTLGGHMGAPFVVDRPSMDLPLGALLALGIVDSHPATIDLFGGRSDWAHLDLQADPQVARIELFDL